MKQPIPGRSSAWRSVCLALLVFALAYSVINLRYLLHLIVYAPVTHFYARAAWAVMGFSVQATLLLMALVFLPRVWFTVLLSLVGLSAGVNLVYDQILNEPLDAARLSWLVNEWHQAGEAAAAFAVPTSVALAKLASVLVSFVFVRRLLRPWLTSLRSPAFASGVARVLVAVLVLSAATVEWAGLAPGGSERNVYSFVATLARAGRPPTRAAVPVAPTADPDIEKIVWLIDESIAYDAYADLIAPRLTGLDAVDFGETASSSNCSAPSNLALRSGVDVRGIDARSDLRVSPSIWGYARAAGFRTVLLDGQKRGRPQNLMLRPELALIDEVTSVETGMDADLRIARALNLRLAAPGREFVYVVLRGAHYDYSRHYPASAVEPGHVPTLRESYELAVEHSKRNFFQTLLDGVERDRIAVFYTSDHGQNIDEAVPPHCSGHPVDSEFAVPLVAFLPERVAATLRRPSPSGHSHSQIFPTTLTLMGYSAEYAERTYDRTLREPTARYVWFGRGAVPESDGARIDVHTGSGFPLR